MKTAHILHQAGDGTATWTVTVSQTGEADRVWTLLPGQSLDATVYYDELTVQKDASDVTPTLTDANSCTLYLRDTVQYFPQPTIVSPLSFGLWVFFWAWLSSRIVP